MWRLSNPAQYKQTSITTVREGEEGGLELMPTLVTRPCQGSANETVVQNPLMTQNKHYQQVRSRSLDAFATSLRWRWESGEQRKARAARVLKSRLSAVLAGIIVRRLLAQKRAEHGVNDVDLR